jgi:hypothetical protein
MNHPAYDSDANSLNVHPFAERVEPNSKWEPASDNHLSDLTKATIVEIPSDKIINQPSSVKLISEQRVREEQLGWLQPIRDGNTLSYGPACDPTQDMYAGRCKIVDADGAVYDGILRDDGSVDEGWFVYDSADTFEYFSRSKDEYNNQPQDALHEPSMVDVAETWAGYWHYSLRQDKETGQLFSHSYHRQSYPSDFIAAVDTVPRLASWLFDLHEQQTVIFPQTGHFVVSLPNELRDQIKRLAHLEDQTTRDWIVQRLSECTQDERSTAALALQEARRKRVAALIEKLRNPTESG